MIFYRYRKSNKYLRDICEAANRFSEGNHQAVNLLQADHPDAFRALVYYLDSEKKEDMISLSVLIELLGRKYRISEEDIDTFLNLIREQSNEMNKQMNMIENYYISIKSGNYHVKSQYSKHIDKVLKNYNPQGLSYSILVTYLECGRDRFKSFIDDYRGHIAEYSPESYSCIGEPEEVSFDGEFLRCMKMQYEVGRIYFAIYHIIVRMGQ